MQKAEEIEALYSKPDPWNYELTQDDRVRRERFQKALLPRSFSRALDIGCGDGFMTEIIPAVHIDACDISKNAIEYAKRKRLTHVSFEACSIFDLADHYPDDSYDLIVITGVLYPKWIGESSAYIRHLVGSKLKRGGTLVSCHIRDWTEFRFAYPCIYRDSYRYRDFFHSLEVYKKVLQ